MQIHDRDDRYLWRAVLTLLSLALLAGISASVINWLTPVHRIMDLVVPPVASAILVGLLIAMLQWPRGALLFARLALLTGGLALVAPAWFYTLQASLTPGMRLVSVLPPVSSLFVALLVMVMIFIPGRRALWVAVLCWILIALPVLVYLFLHTGELGTPRGRELLMSYGPAALLVVVLLPIQGGMAGRIRRLSSERARMTIMLHRDPLTGSHNRRFGHRVLRGHVRSQTPAGVILMDLDRFKSINDTHGHPVGDQVLQAVTQRCKHLLREDECFARWGGEEFLVVLPGVDAQGLALIAERLRVAIADSPVGPPGKVTASFGASMIRPADHLRDVLMRVDQALYEAKARGGNRVEMVQ